MSLPQHPKSAKLIVGFFAKEKSLAPSLVRDLIRLFGPLDMVSAWFDFDFTTYYEKEMGGPLYRRMLVFKSLVNQTRLPQIKHTTNDLENRLLRDGKRRVNIDPGYLVAERFVLATGKNFSHRIYIGEGIFADLTLMYQKGAFRTLPWTYPDYADEGMIDFLTLVRRKYMLDLQTIGKLR